MITSITLELVVSFVNFTTITTPASDGARVISGCAMACQGHGTCGGIVWNVGQVGIYGVVHAMRAGCGMLKYVCCRHTPEVCNIDNKKGTTFFRINSNHS